ncbi:RNI-like superfamily protein isoform 4, partial [Theobroma cacao]
EEQTSLWNKETVPKVMKIVSTRLPQRDLISLLLVSPWLHRTLLSSPSLWLAIDLREMNNAGDRLIAAVSLPRYQHVKQISLEFARDIDDGHLEILKNKCLDSLQGLESLNLNGCQKISDKGIEAITSCCHKLKVFSIYWNNLSERSLQLVADHYQELESLNLTRCVKMTDSGLQQILIRCSFLRSLNLYALSSFTDETYKKISVLSHLRFLDLCGAQNLSDEGLSCIAKCKNLVSLNLTWCVRVTDMGVIAIAEGCTSLEFLSLFGIVGVTDKCLEALSKFCSNTITTLDVNGCIGIKRRSRDDLLQ